MVSGLRTLTEPEQGPRLRLVIRVHKPRRGPSILAERGTPATDDLCRRIGAGQKVNGSFDRSIYGAPAVKDALAAAQHDKCCFCESKVTHVAYGDIEHFRPKAAVRQAPEAPERKPGYYWLAYEWSNLYFACEQCNRRHKRNLFPLENEEDRVLSHEDAALLPEEKPLYIDPGEEDPEQLIGFRKEYAKAIPGDHRSRADATVRDLGLNRDALCARRRERRALVLTTLRNIRSWLASGCPEPQRTLTIRSVEHLSNWLRDDAEYASMTRSLIRKAVPWRALTPTTPPRELLSQLADDALSSRWFAIPPT